MNTVSIARNYVCDAVKGGSSPTSPAVLAAINKAQLELLANKDLVDLLLRRVRFSIGIIVATATSSQKGRNILVCPRDIEEVISYKVDGIPGLMPKSQFYEFLPGGSWTSQEVTGVRTDMVDAGDHWPTMYELDQSYEPMRLYAFSSNAADAGLKLFVEGYDTNNQDILTNGIPGEEVEIVGGLSGVTVTANVATWKPSGGEYKEVTNVVKPVTKGYVALLCKDPDSFAMWNLAMYHPRETNPSFHRYILATPCNEGSCVVALCKVRHVPLEQETDIVLIQNLEALKMQILSNEYLQSDLNKSGQYRQAAIAILRRDVAKKTPDVDVTLSDTWGLGTIYPM